MNTHIIFIVKSIYPYTFGGFEKFVYHLCRELVDNKINITIILPSFRNKRDLNLQIRNIKYIFLNINLNKFINRRIGRVYELLLGFKASRYIKRHKMQYNFIHAFELAAFFPLLFFNKRTVIVHIFSEGYLFRSVIPIKMKTYFNDFFLKHPIVSIFKMWPIKYIIENSINIINEGSFQTKEIKKLYNCKTKQFFEMGVGVDFTRLSNRNFNIVYSRDNLKLNESDFLVIASHRFVKVKGLDYLIEAVIQLVPQYPQLKLLLVGNGPLENVFKSIVIKNCMENNIFIFSELSEDELYSLYNISDLFISPTFNDDYIIGILEAMCFKLPVISTGQRWLVKDNRNGIIVEKANTSALKESIEFLMNNIELCRTYGRESFEIVKKYDWKYLTKEYIRTYKI